RRGRGNAQRGRTAHVSDPSRRPPRNRARTRLRRRTGVDESPDRALPGRSPPGAVAVPRRSRSAAGGRGGRALGERNASDGRPPDRPGVGGARPGPCSRAAEPWGSSIDSCPSRRSRGRRALGYRRAVSASELRAQPPFVRESMAPTFGAIFRARRPGETPAVLYAQAGVLREAL